MRKPPYTKGGFFMGGCFGLQVTLLRLFRWSMNYTSDASGSVQRSGLDRRGVKSVDY